MPAPTYVGSTNSPNATNTPARTLTAPGRSAGDLLVVVVLQANTSAGQTYSVADDKGNVWTQAVRQGGNNRNAEIWYSVVATGGNVAVTVTAANTGNTGYGVALLWATPPSGSTIAYDATSGFAVTTAATAHPCADVGQIDTSADVLVIAASVDNSTPGTLTDPTGYTLTETPLADRSFVWRRESAAALIDERAVWGSTNAIVSTSAIASFKAVGGGGGNQVPVFMHHYGNQGIA